MKVKSADGVSVAYQVKGSGSPALVFVHGWSCDKSYWEPQVSYFSNKHKVVTVDLGGHGESGLERENWTVDAFAADVAAVVNKLDLKKVVLIGHSMGGPVVVEAARLMPERVIGVVGVDTFGDIDRKRMPPPTEDRLARFRSNFVESTREMVKSMFLETSDPKLVEKIILDMSSAPPKVGIGAMKGTSDYDLPKALEKIKAPVRCINSDYRPFDLEAARKHSPSFEIVFMSGVGHFVMLEDPETFNSLLEDIIEGLTSKK
jgi:pimeloyl-ACP methyl ester carboxylesterase